MTGSSSAAPSQGPTPVQAQAPIRQTDIISGVKRKTSWAAREEVRKQKETAKAKERELKQRRADELTKRREIIKERQNKAIEKARAQAMQEKLGRRRALRKAKSIGLTKNVAH